MWPNASKLEWLLYVVWLVSGLVGAVALALSLIGYVEQRRADQYGIVEGSEWIMTYGDDYTE